MRTHELCISLASIFVLTVFFASTSVVHAQSDIQTLQSEIEQKNTQLSNIEAEIAKYEASLREVGAEKNTLQNAINRLNLERKKVLADLNYTNSKINATDLEISKLTLEIQNKEQEVQQNQEAIKAILREFYKADNESLIEVFLRQKNISEFWGEFEELQKVKTTMFDKIHTLKQAKETLEQQREKNTQQKTSLIHLKEQYNDQQNILASNKAEKSELLTTTKNEESNYQALLRKKKEARDTLLAEVRDIESQIKFILDPNSIPVKGTAVFRWPLENPYITQYFGYTKFALSGAYGGSKHNGMDLGAPVGTKIRAPLSGTVRMTGNTDLVPGCYSWGKWTLIDHPNGLSTLFAHQSRIAVVPGQKISTGEVVGYVGNTGYSTGPHLHYTLYVTAGVEVKQFNQFKKVTGCGAALSPFASIDAYLDPLDYLPSL